MGQVVESAAGGLPISREVTALSTTTAEVEALASTCGSLTFRFSSSIPRASRPLGVALSSPSVLLQATVLIPPPSDVPYGLRFANNSACFIIVVLSVNLLCICYFHPRSPVVSFTPNQNWRDLLLHQNRTNIFFPEEGMGRMCAMKVPGIMISSD